MMKPINILAGFATILTVLNLDGCFIARNEGGGHHSYCYDRGDLVIDNKIWYVGWCNTHPRDSHCNSATKVASGER
jgi:hypothetical protein